MKWEAFSIGQRFETGTATVDAEALHAFAVQFDPQPIHVDPDFARHNRFGAVIASGYHTLALSWRLWVELGIQGVDAVAGVNIERLRWIAPVFAGDTLRAVIEIVDLKPRNSQTGFVTLKFTTFNQRQETVLEFYTTGLQTRG